MENEARENGWVSEEEFKANPNNDGKKWRTAEDFMDRKSLFDKIDDQHREIRKLRDGQNALIQHNQTIEKNTRERVLKELQAQKAEAIKEGDVVKVEELRDKIDEVRSQPTTPTPAQNGQVPQELQTWISENQWYTSNQEMRAFADAYGVAQHNLGKPPAEVLKEVSKIVRRTYPTMFQNPNKQSAPPVEGSTSRKGPTSNGKSDLEPFEETIWQSLERAKTPSAKDPKKLMTRDEYVEQLKR